MKTLIVNSYDTTYQMSATTEKITTAVQLTCRQEHKKKYEEFATFHMKSHFFAPNLTSFDPFFFNIFFYCNKREVNEDYYRLKH